MAVLGFNQFDPSLFAQLAFPQSQLMGQANQLPAFALPAILSSYNSVLSGSPLAQNAMIPPFLSMPSPGSVFGMMQPIAGGGYAQSSGLSPFSPNNYLSALFDPQRAASAQFERVLRSDPFARSAFEQALGGRIVDFGNGTGRFSIAPNGINPYAQNLGGGALAPLASQLGGLYQQMNNGVVGGGVGQNPFLPLALNGFTGMANQLMNGGGRNGFDGFGGGVQGMPLFGQGQGSWNPLAAPGKIQGGNAGNEGAHSAQISSVLADPSLSMEDKIMLALMLVCAKMDDDIKRQTEYLNQLQNQQGNRKGGGKAGGGEKSIDLETKKLERMITKRSQLFDTLGKIMERYDQSAKNVIQAMRG